VYIKKPAFVFDLDCTINHVTPVLGGLPIRGRTTGSIIDSRVIELLMEISQHLDLFVATGRSAITVSDFKKHFNDVKLNISGWILEHGSVVEEHPEWIETVLMGIDLDSIHQQVKTIVNAYQLPIDTEYYRQNHKGFLLYSGNGSLLAEKLLSMLSGSLGARFRTIVGKRKFSIIPKGGDKYLAFKAIFGKYHYIAFATGDAPDDLTLLQHASFPLTLAGVSSLVQNYIHKRKGFVSTKEGHEGIVDILKTISCRLANNKNGLPTPGPRLPHEEMEFFRPSRCIFLDNLFAFTTYPQEIPNMQYAKMLGADLKFGEDIVLEVKMRDWGGEVKPLRNLLKTMTLLIPYARWCLVFRQERLGTDNLKTFTAIVEIMNEFSKLPDGRSRFSAPGVPGSPRSDTKSSLTLLLYDHPEDLAPWYDYAITNLIIGHPRKRQTFFINPMFLKISDAFGMMEDFPKSLSPIKMIGPRVMIAANVVDETDIKVSVQGFQRLAGYLDALIIAPRVVTNPVRNRMITEAVSSLGEEIVYLSKISNKDKPRILFVDTYGDLHKLYKNCTITYLGGGFDARKRGFDPMESLLAGVPVIQGPFYDFNRIAVDLLKNSGWISVLPAEATALEDFVNTVRKKITSRPQTNNLKKILSERQADPLRISIELLNTLKRLNNKLY
jgi:hypothetical protein